MIRDEIETINQIKYLLDYRWTYIITSITSSFMNIFRIRLKIRGNN